MWARKMVTQSVNKNKNDQHHHHYHHPKGAN
jgi:hypothetical protein